MKNTSLQSVVLASAALMAFGTGSAIADVQVDQSPLIVAEPLPPNIILMYDDSGSMVYTEMPDLSRRDDFNDPDDNKLYYSPEVVYAAPPQSNGERMPELDFPNGYFDPFDPNENLVLDFVNDEHLPFETIYSNSQGLPSVNYRSNPYVEDVSTVSVLSGLDEAACGSEPDADWQGVSGECRVTQEERDFSYNNENQCERDGGEWVDRFFRSDYCRFETTVVDTGVTDPNNCRGWDSDWVWTDFACVVETQANAFVYIDNGETHYVLEDGLPCGALDNCHNAGDELDLPDVVVGETPATIGENVANFFSYYRTREYAAKSGILTAFSGLNPEYRVGYGSINSNNGGLRAPYRFGSADQVSLDDGQTSNHVRREALWEWMQGVYSNSGTPLRQALERVGDYYDDEDTPWEAGYDKNGNYSTEQFSCRQSYAILLTDGYWNGGDPDVGDSDNKPGSKILSADGQTDYEYSPRDPFRDEADNWLADVAMDYWKRDLRGDLKNDVPTTGRDPAFWQHMTTFTIGLGVEPSGISPSDATIPEIFEWARTGSEPTGFNADDFDWGNDKIADLAHAAVNGHGGFYSAADPQAFSRGLSEALASIDNASGAGNSVSLSGGAGEVVKDGSLSFVGKYVTGEWSGSLKAFSYSSDDGEFNTEEWSAASQMPAAADRNIWTTEDGTVVEFVAGELSGDLKTRLSANIDTPFDVPGNDVVAYLRGDRSYEDAQSSPLGSALRQRASLLGDIVSSTPVPVGAPEPKASAFDYAANGFEGLDAYSTFVEDYKDREPMVYVAANDGMLHGFKQSTGEETFAFLPGSLLDVDGDASLARYANPQYGIYDEVSGDQEIPHQYYNDGEMTTENVFIGGSWKTVLVGTTGRGPTRTVYAIDVTDPSVLADPDQAEDAILWERSAADGGDYEWIGQVLGRPTIWQVKDTGKKTKWVALIGNGPNSGDDEAALLQFDLTDGDLEVIETNNDENNGLAAPTVIMTDPASGVADYAFAGDLRGNVWQFDLDRGRSEKVFEAVGPDGDEQPITARMNATAHPSDGSIWLFFGTGRFLAENDIDRREVQSLYGLRVQARTSGKPEVDASSTRGDDLVERSIVGQENNGDLIERATELGSESDLNPDKAGWYMDLIYDNDAEGERILNIAQLVAGSLYVTTMIPIAGDPCSALPPGATMILDPFSGANPGSEFLALDGYGNLGSIGDIPVNAYITKAGVAGALTFALTEAGETIGVAQNVSGERIKPPGPPAGSGGATRLNWQELYVR